MLVFGRSLFAIALVGFGVLSLIYRDFVHNLQPVNLLVPESTPGYVPLAVLNGLFLIVAGAMLLLRVRVAQVSVALAVFLASWVLFLQFPSAIHYPRLLRSPWWIRTFEVVAMCGVALVLHAQASGPRRERWIGHGRLLFGLSLPVFGVLHLIYGPGTASLIPAFYPFPLALAYFTGVAKIAAGTAIVLDRFSRLAAIMTAVLYAIYTLTLHLPRQFLGRPPEAQRAGTTSLFVAIAFCGAALIVASTLRWRKREGARLRAAAAATP